MPMPTLLAILALVVIGGGAYAYYSAGQTGSEQGTTCTTEAKVCPDGSSVGRSGPNCEFAACPQAQSKAKAPTTQALLDLVSPNGGETFAIDQSVDIRYSLSESLKQQITSGGRAELYLLDTKDMLVGYIGGFDGNSSVYTWVPEKLLHNAGLDMITGPPPVGQYRILALVRPAYKPNCTNCDPSTGTLDSNVSSFSNGKFYFSGKLESLQPTASDVSASSFTIAYTPGSTFTNPEGKTISVMKPDSHRGNDTFFANDPISFGWYSNYYTISPVLYLYNSNNVRVYSRNLGQGVTGSPAKGGEEIPSKQNYPAGSYKVEVCDLGVKDSSGTALCGSSVYFTVSSGSPPYEL